MKKVQILLSTYNGEKYLEEQLDSIINQEYMNLSILIRDDGSTDRTLSILKKYDLKYNNITYYQGDNLGVIGSFFDLVMNADITADYYGFSDQDDVWNKEKIKKAIEVLDTMDREQPLLYCGKTTLVDSKLNPIRSSIRTHNITPDFGNALVENISIGCTSVVNRNLLLLVKEHIPNFTVMHDWWFYLTASCFGQVYYDKRAYILYRQHGDNVIGMKNSYLSEFKNRVKNYRKNRGKISSQVNEFNRLYVSNDKNQKMIKELLNSKKNLRYRMKIIFTNDIHRQRRLDNMIFKMLFLLGNI